MTDFVALPDRHEWWGRWWLPGAPEDSHSGRLNFDVEEGPILRLIGGFATRRMAEVVPGIRFDQGAIRQWPVVHGKVDNRPVTLLRTWFAGGMSYILGEPDSQFLRAQSVLLGLHVFDPEAAVFTGSAASVENLTVWSDSSPISARSTFRDGEGRGDGAAFIRVGPSETRSAFINGATIKLLRETASPERVIGRTAVRAAVHDAPYVQVEFARPVTLDEALVPLIGIKDLVSFATNEPAGFFWHNVLVESENGSASEFPDSDQRFRSSSVVQCLQAQSVPARPDGTPADVYDISFNLADIAFAEIVPRWFEISTRSRAAVSMIMDGRYSRSPSLESRVGSIVTAAEALHRSLPPQPPIPHEEMKTLRATLMKVVPENRREWLAGKLASNEPGLRRRLRALFERLPPELSHAVLRDPRGWAARTVVARNELAHSGHANSLSRTELRAMVEVTEWIVALNLLHDLNIPVDRLAVRLESNRSLIMASRVAQHFFESEESSGP